MVSSYLILVVVFLLCLLLRTGYELLKEAGKIDPENKLIFSLIFSAMCVLWVSWFSLCPLDPSLVNVPEAVRWIGLGLFIGGMIFAFGALVQLRGVENIKHLVTTGLFVKIRHPMYAGFVLWILGWSIYHNAILSLFVGLIGITNILYWRRLEEARLLAQYGDAYEQYRLRTWF